MDKPYLLGFHSDQFDDSIKWNNLVIDHAADLNTLFFFNKNTNSTSFCKSTFCFSDALSNLFGDFDVCSVKADVESNKRSSDSKGHCAGSRMQFCFSIIREPFRLSDELLKSFVLRMANVLQLYSFFFFCGFLVEIYGHFNSQKMRSPKRFCVFNAFFNSNVFNRNNRRGVNSTDSWMFAVVAIHVDFFNRNLTGSEGGFRDSFRFSYDRVDTTVVAWIDVNIN